MENEKLEDLRDQINSLDNQMIELLDQRSLIVTEVGKLKLDKVKTEIIENGDVGYVVTSLKDVSEINVGDTISLKEQKEVEALPGYKEIKPMVFI